MKICKLLIISKLVLVALLVYAAVAMLLPLRNLSELFTPVSASGSEQFPVDPGRSATETDGPAGDSSLIVQANIFGPAANPSDQRAHNPTVSTPGLPPSAESELGLELLGVVSGGPALSRAIIKNTKTGAVDLYRTGQDVVPGACVKTIADQVVILLHQGQEKMLSLRTAAASSKPASATGPGKAGNPAVKSPAPAATTSGGARSARPLSTLAYVMNFLNRATIQPYKVNGQVEGLKITGIENAPDAEALGLKNGDIIRQVNGQRLTSLQKAFQVMQKARYQRSIDIELLRQGRSKKLCFDL